MRVNRSAIQTFDCSSFGKKGSRRNPEMARATVSALIRSLVAEAAALMRFCPPVSRDHEGLELPGPDEPEECYRKLQELFGDFLTPDAVSSGIESIWRCGWHRVRSSTLGRRCGWCGSRSIKE